MLSFVVNLLVDSLWKSWVWLGFNQPFSVDQQWAVTSPAKFFNQLLSSLMPILYTAEQALIPVVNAGFYTQPTAITKEMKN